jgi:hypothetical protein
MQKDISVILEKIKDAKTTKDKEEFDIRDIISLKIGSVLAKMESNHQIILHQNEEIISHQKIANGRTKKLEDSRESIDNEIDIINHQINQMISYGKFLRWVSINPGKSVIILVSLIFISSVVVDAIGFKAIIEYIKEF